MTQNVPARTEGQKPMTPAERSRAKMDALIHAVQDRASQLETLLRDSGISFDRFVEVFRRALIRNPDLMEADAASVIEACMNACTDGLLPDGRQGAIVVYRVNVAKRRQDPAQYVKKAQWQPMYQGLLDVAYRAGNFKSIEARVVYAGDKFSYQLGDKPKITHVPARRARGEAQPEIVAAYATAITVNGGVFREVMEGFDLEKIQKVARAQSGPGKDWPEEMSRKAPLRRMWKYLPKNEAMNRIADHDDDNFDLEQLGDEEAAAAPERKIQRGFGKPAPQPAPPAPALTQSADPVMDMAMDVVGDEEGEPLDAGASDPGPSNEAAKSDTPAREPADEQPSGPVSDFRKNVAAARSWLNLKQALRTLAKGDPELVNAAARAFVWGRFLELRQEGEKTDFVTDPLLFECWLDGAQPSPEEIEGNWAVVQTDRNFQKLSEDEQGRVGVHVAEASRRGADHG